jgi:hypothetical protein
LWKQRGLHGSGQSPNGRIVGCLLDHDSVIQGSRTVKLAESSKQTETPKSQATKSPFHTLDLRLFFGIRATIIGTPDLHTAHALLLHSNGQNFPIHPSLVDLI